jgi:hypothetical protein
MRAIARGDGPSAVLRSSLWLLYVSYRFSSVGPAAVSGLVFCAEWDNISLP